jgi:hypothetical protein
LGYPSPLEVRYAEVLAKIEESCNPRRTYAQEREKRSLRVDQKKFDGIVRNLLQSPVKREDVKVPKKKPAKLFPPQK